MTLDDWLREQLLSHPSELRDEGVEPDRHLAGRNWNQKENRKAKQLCRQVAETLELVLSGECQDELLQSLRVISVVPAPNSSRLLVSVSADLLPGQYDRQRILELLDDHSRRLRSEVAASINRKRVPQLVFQVVGPSWPVP